jgi:predicted GNAT family acetyltransferase
MSRKAVVAVVDVIADAGVDLPGVAAVSAGVLAAGRRCILYTDLGNPTSNSVYRRIGYRAVVECLRYRFT